MSSQNSKSCWAFDIDGVIADTRDAVHAAYLQAGIWQPDDAWGISWKRWLPALTDSPEAVHAAKQRAYEEMLRDGYRLKKLPGCDMAHELIDAGHRVYFVTAASMRSAQAVLRHCGLPTIMLAGSELTPEARVGVLAQLRSLTQDASYHSYVDDREEGAEIAADAGWLFTHAQWTQ